MTKSTKVSILVVLVASYFAIGAFWIKTHEDNKKALAAIALAKATVQSAPAKDCKDEVTKIAALENELKALKEFVNKPTTVMDVGPSNELYWNPNGGEWAVVISSSPSMRQAIKDLKNADAVFGQCSNETDYLLRPCITFAWNPATNKSDKSTKYLIATTEKGLSARWALRVAECFNRNMKPLASGKKADAIKSRNFEAVCL